MECLSSPLEPSELVKAGTGFSIIYLTVVPSLQYPFLLKWMPTRASSFKFLAGEPIPLKYIRDPICKDC